MSHSASRSHRSGVDDKSMPGQRSRRRRQDLGVVSMLVGGLVLLLLPWIGFFPILNSDFSTADADFVVRGEDGSDLAYREIWSPERVVSGNPIAATLNRLEQELTGNSTAWRHRINLGIHGLNALLLWWVMRLGGIRVAFATALFWAVHPAVFQAIYWPGYRSLLLGMSALLVPLGLILGAEGRWRYAGGMIATFFAPFVHLVALLIPLIFACFRIRFIRKEGARAFNPVLPYGLIAVACGLILSQAASETFTTERPVKIETEAAVTVAEMPLAYFSDQVKFALRRAYLPFEFELFTRFQARAEEGARTVPGEDLVSILVLFSPLILVIGQWRHRWARNLAVAWFLMVIFLFFFLLHPGAGPGGEHVHEDAYLYFLLPVAIGFGLGVGRLIVARVESKGMALHVLATVFVFLPLPIASVFAASKVSNEVSAWTSVQASLPDSWAARLGYVQAHLASDTSEVAFDELQEGLLSILQARPDLVELRRNLLELYREAGRLESAEREVRRLLSENPRDVDLLVLLAELNQELERELEVITAHERILALQPDRNDSLRTLASIHQRNRRHDQAARLLERLRTLAPEDVAVASDLMRSYRLLNRVDEAREIYDQIDPADMLVEAQMEGIFLDAAFNPQAAKIRLRELVEEHSLSALAKTRIVRFIASMREVEPEDAIFIRDLARDAVLASDASDSNVQYTLGIALSIAGEHVQAQRALRQARASARAERNTLLFEQIDSALRFAEDSQRVEGSLE